MDLDDVDSNLWHISDMFKSTWEVGYKGTHEFKKKIGRKDHGVNIALYYVFIESSEVVINTHNIS